jgi:hypothetical protein
LAQYRTMPFSPLNETGLHYERSGAGEALVLVHRSWVDDLAWLIEALEGFATGVAHG